MNSVRVKEVALLLLMATAILLIVQFASVRQTASDPRATLLVSESILDRGTIKLGHYGEELLESYGYAIHQRNGHFYNYFPMGTAIASLPFVYAAKALEVDVVASESEIQIAIASILSAAKFVLLFCLARLFVPYQSAFWLSSVFWLGTSFASTEATALWSHNFATLFSLLAILLAVKSTKRNKQYYWLGISIFLFFAYLCRPTLSILSPFLLLYLYAYNKRDAAKCAGAIGLWLLAFSMFSLQEFNQLLPDYYLPARIYESGTVSEAVYGNLLSPARGILIYSPFLVSVWLFSGNNRLDTRWLWLSLGLAWPLVHLLLISRFPHWWAGHSFGARLMTDALPGLFLLTLYKWPTTPKLTHKRDVIATCALISTCAFSIVVNTGQGLFNEQTDVWNYTPDINVHPEYLFDWRYPQFLASRERNQQRLYFHRNRQELARANPGAGDATGQGPLEAPQRTLTPEFVIPAQGGPGHAKLVAAALGGELPGVVLLMDQRVATFDIFEDGWTRGIEAGYIFLGNPTSRPLVYEALLSGGGKKGGGPQTVLVQSGSWKRQLSLPLFQQQRLELPEVPPGGGLVVALRAERSWIPAGDLRVLGTWLQGVRVVSSAP